MCRVCRVYRLHRGHFKGILFYLVQIVPPISRTTQVALKPLNPQAVLPVNVWSRIG